MVLGVVIRFGIRLIMMRCVWEGHVSDGGNGIREGRVSYFWHN